MKPVQSSNSSSAGGFIRFLLPAVLLAAGCGSDSAKTGSENAASEDAATTNPGNSLGVGKTCTKGGGECNNQPAVFCTADYSTSGFAFCTKPCATDAECGENAVCTGENDSGPKGCVPVEIAGNGDGG